MTPTHGHRFTVTTLVLAMSTGAFAQTRLVVPADPKLAAQISAAVRAAEDDGNYAAALREDRRWLELYPNEPVLQAAIYQTMSATAEKSGDAKAAAEFASIAKALDPTLAPRLAAGQSSTTTRGDKADKFMAAMSVAMATMSAVQQARQQSKAQAQMQTPMQMPMQPQQMQPPMQQPMPPQAMPPQQPMQGQPMQQAYAYPPAPVGAPGYQPAPQPMPMPGYAPQGYPSAPGQPGGYMPAPGQPAGYMPPPGQPAMPPPGSPAQAPPQGYAPQGYPPQGPAPAGYPPPGYYAPADPNAAPPGYAPAAVIRRGDALKPMRVVHDHSLADAPAYFATACGALLSVDGTNLIFTPGGGESPRVIPAADIREMRMNTTVGKDVGAFHIATKQGLYLHLAPESGKSDDARAIIDALTKALGL